MSKLLGERAVVIGGSIAGLMTAHVLADHFEEVIVLERDHLEDRPAIHRSIPQGNHLHALLLAEQQVLSNLYPGFTDRLQSLGALRLRMGKDNAVLIPDGKAYSLGGAVKEPRDLGIDLDCQSRRLLEYCLRQCTSQLPNITFRSDCAARGLIDSKGRIGGVVYDNGGASHRMTSDLVVDAGGRGSHAPRWLRELGFAAPEEATIGVDFAYTSAKYRIPNWSEPERLLSLRASGPDDPKIGLIEEIEGNVFHLSLGGRFGEYPPADEQGFLAFAKSLRTSKLYKLIKDAERVTDIATYRFPTSVRRHYERLPVFPEGFLVLGDAVSSFNPIYGQGMSSAALQVQALENLLSERAEGTARLDGLARIFFARSAEIVNAPWTLAANADFAYPQTTGERPPGVEEVLHGIGRTLRGRSPSPYSGNESHQSGDLAINVERRTSSQSGTGKDENTKCRRLKNEAAKCSVLKRSFHGVRSGAAAVSIARRQSHAGIGTPGRPAPLDHRSPSIRRSISPISKNPSPQD